MKKYILLEHGGELELDFAIENANLLRKSEWEFKKYKAGPALMDKNGGTSRPYVGQKYDLTKMDLKLDGWNHDHCEICFTTIAEGETNKEYEFEGFHSDSSWICKNCHSIFIKPKELAEGIEMLKIIEK